MHEVDTAVWRCSAQKKPPLHAHRPATTCEVTCEGAIENPTASARSAKSRSLTRTKFEIAKKKKLSSQFKTQKAIKVNKQDALEMGKSVCPLVIEMYAEGLKTLIKQIPFVSSSYTINTEKLKASIACDKYFCDNLAIKISSKMIEQMGENSFARVGVSLAAKTLDAIEPVRKVVINERSTCENFLSAAKSVKREESNNRASKSDGASS